MIKIFFIGLLVWTLSFFALASSILAIDSPACNPAEVNLSKPVQVPNCTPVGIDPGPSWPRPCKPNEASCPANMVFCTKNELLIASWTGCWFKFQIGDSKEPTCPPGCCSDLVGQCFKKTDPFCGYDSNKPCIKNFCGTDGAFQYDSETKSCKSIGKSKWDLEKSCLVDTDGNGHGVETAIGCVPTDDLPQLIVFVLRFVFFAAGGIILLMIIVTGYNLATSGGNPEKLQGAKENIVSIFSGLILIAFSLILLQIIGADILRLPPFIK